jgi:putative SOS response-associated peptidase YedK
MCGRFVITSAPDAIRRLLRYEEQPNFPPRYNVAPTQPIPIARLDRGARHFALARWGLIPPSTKDAKRAPLLINARLEGVNTTRAFRAAMQSRRCLIPADGFYEWKKEGKEKRPFFFRSRDEEPFAFAGLWETWIDPDGNTVESTAIITCAANEQVTAIHDRMPVILPPERHDAWLDAAKVNAAEAAALVGPAPNDFLLAYEVSARVNSYQNDGPENLIPASPG